MEGFIPMPEQSNVVPQNAVSTILLCKGVPWDANYSHVRLFGNKSELHSYIQSKAVKTIQSSTPVMFGDFTYSVDGNQEEIMRCNYMAFLNTPYTSEWKYAFVTGIEWLSVNSCRIKYRLDVWQNNIYDVTIGKCYVEREHCSKELDAIDYSLVPENLETGDFKLNWLIRTHLGDPKYCLLVSAKANGEPPDAVGAYGGVYSGLGLISSLDEENFNLIVQGYQNVGMAESIVAIYTVPSGFKDKPDAGFTEVEIPFPTSLDNYIPKNKKLFQYPYNFCFVTCNTDSNMILKYELSDNENNTLKIGWHGLVVPSPMLRVVAMNYNGLGTNYQQSFEVSGYPQGAWINDAFQAYLAQQTPVIMSQMERVKYKSDYMENKQWYSSIGQFISALGNALTQNVGGAAQNVFNGIVEADITEQAIGVMQDSFISASNAQVQSHDLIPPKMSGNINSSFLNTVEGINAIDVTNYCVQAQMAAVIDDYWTMLGYPMHRCKVPNINTRSAWNYVKTVNCALSGSVMLQDLETLRKIFDNGVTIWHTNDVGNYALDNV